MMRIRTSPHLLLLLSTTLLAAEPLRADLIPPGSKGVSHQLVFEDSPLLKTHRIIAMPTRGFRGFAEVRPNQPFFFSTKYGTKLYAVPNDFEPPERVGPGSSLPFPAGSIPITATTFVPIFSPTASLISTCKLVAVNDEELQVELVDHVHLNSAGKPVTATDAIIPGLLICSIVLTGFVGCGLIWRRTRKQRFSHINAAKTDYD